MSGSAPSPSTTVRRLRPWPVRLVARRGRAQWQLVALVAAIAVLASTLISSLTVLVAATEVGGFRGALSAATESETQVRVFLKRPTVPITEAREAVEKTTRGIFGDAATAHSHLLAGSEIYSIPNGTPRAPLVYLGEVQGIDEATQLIDGDWPSDAGEIAIPAESAWMLELAVGDELKLRNTMPNQGTPTFTIVGIYEINDRRDALWRGDLLGGAGHDSRYPVPGTGGALTTDAFGPFILPEGTFDATGIPVERVVVRDIPDFADTTSEALAPLLQRLVDAPKAAPVTIGKIAATVTVTGSLPALLTSIAEIMSVTRSIVAILGLLLVVLAVAALSQAARLLTEARTAERHLARARGASHRQLLALAGVEALIITVGAVVLSAVLARAVYLLVAQHPSMVAAGMAEDPGTPAIVWIVAAATGALFWVVLIAPLLGREQSFQEGEQGKARQRRFSGLQRSGVDIAVLVIAGVAYAQLLAYRGPLSDSSLGIDPLLVAGPALVLLAGALLTARLIPASSLLTERIAERGRGVVAPLAAWEIGRRAQKATAAILLVTLALAVGTFSHAFLASWRQSQIDQASFALGAPLRLTSGSPVLEVPPAAQPVVREPARIAVVDSNWVFANENAGEPSTILGLNAATRELLRDGRVGEEGGIELAELLKAPAELLADLPLPDYTVGVSARVALTPMEPMEGVSAQLSLLLEDSAGRQYSIYLGSAAIDGEERTVRGTLDDGVARNGLRIIGIQASAYVEYPELHAQDDFVPAQLTIGELFAMKPPSENTPAGAYEGEPITVDGRPWFATGYGDYTVNAPSAFEPKGWQLGLRFTVPRDVDRKPRSYVLVGWNPTDEVDVVLSQPLADLLETHLQGRVSWMQGDAVITGRVVGIIPLVPGGGLESTVSALGTIDGNHAYTLVVDEVALARSLYQQVGMLAPVTEWWMHIDPDDVESYIPYLAVQYEALTAQSAELISTGMLQDPRRVATQGALWLAIGGAAILAAVGFAVHSGGSLRARATEFAQLRAVGLSRRRLVGIIGIESVLLSAIGTIFGLVLGVALAYLVGPLIGVAADGSVAVPAVLVVIPFADVAVLVLGLTAVLALVVLLAAIAQRVAEPATALRQGEER
jgi:hypothetical protein